MKAPFSIGDVQIFCKRSGYEDPKKEWIDRSFLLGDCSSGSCQLLRA